MEKSGIQSTWGKIDCKERKEDYVKIRQIER